MEEVVDVLVEKIEKDLSYKGIELSLSDTDEIRDILDSVLEKYSQG